MVAGGEGAVNGDRPASLAQQKASDPSASAWVNANAGSGKTHVVVDRLIRLMLAGMEPSRILCLTFTRAAAAEMASRLSARLGKWILLPDGELEEALRGIGIGDPTAEQLGRARQLFAAALEVPGGLKIQTIHAFCERLLQLFPVEAGVVPHFSVMEEGAVREAVSAAKRRVLRDAGCHPDGPLGRALAEIVRHVQPDGFDELLKAILAERADVEAWLANAAGIARAEEELRRQCALAPGEDEVRVARSLALDQDTYRRLISALQAGNANDRNRAADLAKVLGGGDANLRQLQDFYLTDERECRAPNRIATKAVATRHAWVIDFIAAEQSRLVTGLAKLGDLARIAATVALLTVAGAVLRAFEREKRRLGAYDFDDLIVRTARLLGERPDAAWVLYKLDGGIDHVLVDEAQDTSPEQWQIVRSLTEEFFAGAGRRESADRTVFCVGDPKQLIFSFQGADLDAYKQVHREFAARVQDAGQRFNDVDFTVSFRSVPAVLEAVDAVLAEDGGAAVDAVHESNRRGEPGSVDIWPLAEPDAREEVEPWHVPVDREPAHAPHRKLARHIAATVKSWIGRRLIATGNRPVRPGDILILVRTRNRFFDALIRELRNADVPVAGADRLKLMENLAVLDLIALARFCLNERDDHSLACLLKSPLLDRPFTEEEVFEVAWQRGRTSLWERIAGSPTPHCAAAAARLSRWRTAARALAPFEFFAGVLNETRRAFLARLGSEAKDALDAFLSKTLDYEASRNGSLQGFVHWFAAGEIEIKRNMEQAAGEVRIMTVHGAKGLEAPIVILPDTVAKPDERTASALLMIDQRLPLWRIPGAFESEALARFRAGARSARDFEYRRLLYVAMTRARDELHVCGWRGKTEPKPDCWYNLVAAALKPRMRELAGQAGWRMGDDPVWCADAAAAAPEGPGQVPGWALRPPAPEPRGRETAAASRLIDGGQRTAARRTAIERGVAIHRILQLIADVAPDGRAGFLSRIAARYGFGEALAAEVAALIARPHLERLFAPGGLSEVPVVAAVAELGATVSGRIDRLVIDEESVLAVDYKSDRDWPASPDAIRPEYAAQMAAYRAALAALYPGRPIRCAILWTSPALYMELPAPLLDAALPPLSSRRKSL
jgi:ATP-dependent helicase/nuclease subunit A